MNSLVTPSYSRTNSVTLDYQDNPHSRDLSSIDISRLESSSKVERSSTESRFTSPQNTNSLGYPSVASNWKTKDQVDYDKERKYAGQILKTLWSDKDCKRLFIFIILLAIVSTIQLVYGTWAGSLGLITASFHSSFDCISMAISLGAMVLAKHGPTNKFSYGFDRVEVLSGFSNGVFFGVCFYVLNL